MTVKEWIGLPALIVAAILAIGAILSWLGVDLTTAPLKLQRHIVAESTYHASREPKITELDRHAEANERLLEALVRGECLENPYADLARQGLIRTCDSLGVRRAP